MANCVDSDLVHVKLVLNLFFVVVSLPFIKKKRKRVLAA